MKTVIRNDFVVGELKPALKLMIDEKIDVKKLSIVDVILQRNGSISLRIIHSVCSVAIGLFYRRIELHFLENLPEKCGVIYVLNHPNALIDPLLVFVALPRQISFLAKSTIFKMPVLGFLVKSVGALPVYRQQDGGADAAKNNRTFELSREVLKKNGAIALFPEGLSHTKPQLMPMKTGAARIALGASSSGKNPSSLDLKIVPVGLFYTDKMAFRSEALLYFGKAFDVPPVDLDENGQPLKDAVRELTAKIDEAIRQVTFNAQSEVELKNAHVAEHIFTSVTEHEENLAERLAFLRTFVKEIPAGTNLKLDKQITEYSEKLNKLGLESEFLELANYSKWFILKRSIVRSWYLVALAPFSIFGIILHLPAYQFCRYLAYLEVKKGDLDMASTMKFVAGIVLIPVTWLVLAGILDYFFNWKVALLSIPLSIVCGYVAMRSLEEISDMRGWFKAISIFFRKRDKFLRLLVERRKIFEELKR